MPIVLMGCSTTMKDYQGFIEKYPQNRFCVLAVEPVRQGKTDEAVQSGRVSSYTQCSNTEENARTVAIDQCTSKVGKQCVVAFEYDRNYNRYRSNQAQNTNDYRLAVIESKMKKCDGYGFKRGSTPFAQCLQQIENQELMDASVQMQRNELNRQEQERNIQKSQCFLAGRWDC